MERTKRCGTYCRHTTLKLDGGGAGTPLEGGDDGWVGPVEVKAMCWHGGTGERPADLQNEVVNLTADVETGETTFVVGEIPERSTAPENPRSYSCVFGFSQGIHKNDAAVTSGTTLFFEGEEGTHTSGGVERVVTGYITEGTNDQGKGFVTVVEERVKPSPNMQQWLDGKQASEASGELWKHFRRSENMDTNRNPWQACMNKDRCGVAG